MTLTRREAVKIIERHGWLPGDCTSTHNPDAECNHKDGSFDLDLGIRSSYSTSEIKRWLGY